jgi:acyl transferase domain-containing protein/acyl carrier protein
LGKTVAQDSLEGVAVVGMSCRFPGAGDPARFWRNLREGAESISFFSAEELAQAGVEAARIRDLRYVAAWGVVEGAELFDAFFFGFSPREAEVVDPQQRLFLECAWEALEHAGYDPERYAGVIGVYAGAGKNNYAASLRANRALLETVGHFQLDLGTDKDHLATRVAYKLNLRGPGLTVQTACSTALVAVHLASQSLQNYECDMALAGGVSVKLPQKTGYLFEEGGIASSDGHCRAFDARAEGVVGGNGAGVVLLKRLEDALADGDTVHAVIKGSAVNNDGSAKVGYAAPSVSGQAEVIAAAQGLAGVGADDITYVEAHGAATPLGDPVEIAALTKAFRAGTHRRHYCAVGSVKTNVGHLHEAAGIAGFIKTVLALGHKQLPPSLHFRSPNPEIDFERSPFFVNTALRDWRGPGGAPLRAGVSSFGLGGTNAHVVLEEAPAAEPPDPSRPSQLLLLSARTAESLERATERLAEHLAENPGANLADVAYTYQTGRRAFGRRRMVVCQTVADALDALRDCDRRRILTNVLSEAGEPHVTFMFPGLGDHYAGMGGGLYRLEPFFREQVDRCASILRPLLNLDLREVLYPADAEAAAPAAAAQKLDLRKMLRREGPDAGGPPRPLNQTRYAQPAVFVVEYALARLLMEWGVRPHSMIGYSIGEYVAACLSGVLSLEDALTLVARRAEMIEELPGGSMLAVPLSESGLRPLLGPRLSVAAVNAEALCVAAGEGEAVEELRARLEASGLGCVQLQTSHAFHSEMMRPIAEEFERVAGGVKMGAPQIPYLSNVTGGWITEAEAASPSYWSRHLCGTVRFAEGVRELCSGPRRVLLEVGPGQLLSSLAVQHAAAAGEAQTKAFASMRPAYDNQSDPAFLLNALGRLWLAGVRVNWEKFYAGERRRRVPLPTYQFDRQNYTLTASLPARGVSVARESAEKGEADWFYVPVWKQSLKPAGFERSPAATAAAGWLLFDDGEGLGARLTERLRAFGQEVVTVRRGARFGRLGDEAYALDPRERTGYDSLLEDLRASGLRPRKVLHLWGLGRGDASVEEAVEEAQHRGFFSLVYVAQALGRQGVTEPLHIWCVSNGLHKVESADVVFPHHATLLAPLKVIPQEYPNVVCRSIDLSHAEGVGSHSEELPDYLLAEFGAESSDLLVAYRGARRWALTFEPVALRDAGVPGKPQTEPGVYMILGGLEGAGLALARRIAVAEGVRLLVADASGLPPAAEWDAWLSSHDARDDTGRKIREARTLREAGVEVVCEGRETFDESALRDLLARARGRFAAPDCLIYAGAAADARLFASVQEVGDARFTQHYLEKVRGALALGKVLREAGVARCVWLTSLSTVLGGVGSVAYTGANLVYDALAHAHDPSEGARWRSVNLNKGRTREQGQTYGASGGETAPTPDEYEAILNHALALDAPQLVVSRTDLHVRLDRWIGLESFRGGPAAEERPAASHARPHLNNAYVAPGTETERAVAGLWQDLLGIAGVGVYDNFFELGGHSLSGIQLMAAVRRELRVDLPLTAFFARPTVSDLAALVDDSRMTAAAPRQGRP